MEIVLRRGAGATVNPAPQAGQKRASSALLAPHAEQVCMPAKGSPDA